MKKTALTTTHTLLLGFLYFLLSGCLNARKLDNQVAKEYADRKALTQMPKNTEKIVISSSLIDGGEQMSVSETKTSNMLPLLFYWSWEYRNSCKLNPRVPINLLVTQITKSAALKEKLAGHRLELTIDQAPSAFAIIDKAHVIFVLYAFGWDNVTIKGDAVNLSAHYKVFDGGNEIKNGQIVIPSFENKKGIGMFTSWKTALSDFLQQYDAGVATMNKAFIASLVKEL